MCMLVTNSITHIHKCGLVIHLVTCESFVGYALPKPLMTFQKKMIFMCLLALFILQVTKKDGNLYSPMRFQFDII